MDLLRKLAEGNYRDRRIGEESAKEVSGRSKFNGANGAPYEDYPVTVAPFRRTGLKAAASVSTSLRYCLSKEVRKTKRGGAEMAAPQIEVQSGRRQAGVASV